MPERDNFFDFIKGFLIFLVVWGHVVQFFCVGNPLHNPTYIWIYSFHMPLFIFVSGYFATRTVNGDITTCVKTRWHRLLLPALIWTVVRFFSVNIHTVEELGLLQSIYNSFRGIWFLYCLFALYIIACLSFKLRYKYTLLVLAIIIGYVSYPYQPVDVLKHFQIIRQLPLFTLGLFYASHKTFANKFKWGGYVICLILYVAWLYVAIVDHKLLFSNETYLVRGAILVIASMVFFVTLKIIYKYIKSTKITQVLVALGENTLGIYMLNGLMVYGLDGLIPQQESQISLFLFSIIITLICYGITLLIKRNRTLKQYLLGEKR